MSRSRKPAGRAGRRPSTSAAEISAIGIALFSDRGFEETSVEEVAEAAGIARRTFFRYFPSKNAVPWGEFDHHLEQMRAGLDALPGDVSLAEGLRRILIRFNTFPETEASTHRRRMALILGAPSLQAYSMLMYTDWRQAIAGYVAGRLSLRSTDHLPQSVAWTMLGVALSSYETWLNDEGADLHMLLEEGMRVLIEGLGSLSAVEGPPPGIQAAKEATPCAAGADEAGAYTTESNR